MIAMGHVLRGGGALRNASSSAPDYHGKLRFLAIGDSYTIGESVDVPDRYPNQLATQLRQGGIDLSDPVIIARTGWTTGDLLDAVDSLHPENDFDLVALLIGVNNQFQGRSENEYREQFQTLLARSVLFARGNPARVLVISIPDWGATPFGKNNEPSRIAERIDSFNKINREETERSGAAYVDVTRISRQAATQAALTADDGLHPSGAQYRLWTDAMKPIVTEMLRK